VYARTMRSLIDQRARFQLAQLGAAVGDPSRAAMLVALLGGVALPASGLAQLAGVSASTATSHLRHLQSVGLVTVRAQGRHRYFALADQRIADALEGMAGLCLPQVPRRTPLSEPLAIARTCYSHLAGRVAVAFWQRAAQAAWVSWTDGAVRLLPKGISALGRCGLLDSTPGSLAGTSCLDWSERVPHVAGRLGVALCDDLLARGWVKRVAGGRALRVTVRGHEGFGSLGVRWMG
jgi:DNA-binding transcriptional ArsR family regulator